MRLYVMNGYDEGLFLELDRDKMRLGRSTSTAKDGIRNDRGLSHDSRISGSHALFFKKDDSWFAEDLESTHGIFVNHRKLLSPTEIYAKDVILMGSTLLLVCDDEGELPEMAIKQLAMAR